LQICNSGRPGRHDPVSRQHDNQAVLLSMGKLLLPFASFPERIAGWPHLMLQNANGLGGRAPNGG
jgi:hypothetical protein